MTEEPVHLTTTEARGATKSRMTRGVLAISLGLVIVLFTVVVAGGWMR